MMPAMPRFLIAPDKFKGSLSAAAAAAAIAAGIHQSNPDAAIDLCPIADGGEGFMETMATAMNGRWITCPAVDALGRPIDSRYVIADTAAGPLAVMEMAETAGMWRIAANERDPLHATTFGTGIQIAHALEHHQVTRIILGLGGSATNDAGCGMAAALGVAFLDAAGTAVNPLPAHLSRVATIDLRTRIALPPITAACDVDNPLLGDRGATAVFSTQKGAGAQDKALLENALARVVALSGGGAAAITPGAGAAGGLGFGLLHFAAARLVSGFDLLAEVLQLEQRVLAADHVITGEGSIDHQSLSGKGPVALARLARSHGIPVTAFCGIADDSARQSALFDEIHALADSGQPLEILIAEAAPLLTASVAKARFSKS